MPDFSKLLSQQVLTESRAREGVTQNGIGELQHLLADIRMWDGGIRHFSVDEQCDPEMIERVMDDDMTRVLKLCGLNHINMRSPDA